MKNKIVNLLFVFLVLLMITSCTSTRIIPKGYTNKENYTTANISQLNNTLQLSIYKYEKRPNLNNNKFSKPISNNFEELEELLIRFEQEIENYDFKDKYDIKLEDISTDDYVYIDYRISEKEQFSIYFFDSSQNILYYCYMIIQNEVEEV